MKSMDSMVMQRRAMAEAAGDFSSSLHALSTVELSPTLSGPLEALSDLQLTIRDIYDRQAQQDVLTFGIVIDEYVRLIGSVKQAFQQRQKAFYSWHNAEAELQKRRTTQDKLLRQGKSQQDRLNQVSAEVADAERKVHQARLLFDDMGRLMRAELDRFEREKVEDFKGSVETFLESAVEAQKEVSICVRIKVHGCSPANLWVAVDREMGDFLDAAGCRRRRHGVLPWPQPCRRRQSWERPWGYGC